MLRSLLVLTLAAAPALAQVPAAVDKGALGPGPLEVAIEPLASHAFAVALEAGHAYHVEVEQLETYLEVRWAAAGHTRRANDRTERTGREEVFWAADGPGTGTLTVGNLTSRAGRYRIALAARPSTDSDRARHAAEIAAVGADLPARMAAAERFGALGVPHRQIRTLDRAAYRAAATGDRSVARAAATECVGLARREKREEATASCLLALAHAIEDSGEGERADASYAEAIAIRERLGDPLPLAHALADSAQVFILRGEYERSDALHRRATALAREVGDSYTEAVCQLGLATVAAYRGRVEEMLEASERARDIGRRRGSAEIEAAATLNAGIAYASLGAFSRATSRIREAIALAEKDGLKPTVAQGLLALGGAAEDAGDLATAQRELERSVAVAREIEAPVLRAGGETLLGWVLARRGRPDEAERHLRDASAAAQEAGARLEGATADLYTGKARLLAGRPEEAAGPLERARAAFRASERLDDEGRATLALAGVARARGDLAGASARAEEALALFESVRVRVALADQRAHYAAFRREAYDLAIGLLVERDRREPGADHLAHAFDLTERARGRALAEELETRRAGRRAVPPELAAAHQRALDRLGHLQRQLVALHTSAAPGAAEVGRLEDELREAVASEEVARRTVREQGPRTATASRPVPTAAEHARLLAPDEAIVLYHVAEGGSWLFAVTRQGLTVHPLPGTAALRAQVDGLRTMLSAPRTLGAPAYATAARGAYDVLLAPVVAGRPHLRRLRIVPDGPLWEIPFEALVTGDGGARYADLPYVLRRFTVSYHPSAGGMPATASPTAEGTTLVAFANPRLPDDAAAREPVERLTRAVFREGERWSLPRLACAEREAHEVAALFGAAASVHTGAAAQESVVKADPRVARARYLLFSTHALLSETMPSQSSLVLALSGDGAEDGLLQAYEIDALRLEADLVVLSGCETGLGDNVRGEGLLGLARSFFHAGARRLVASLWRVADCSTADLTVELFRQVHGQTSADPAEALRAAKLRLLARPAYAHPYHWAPFVVVG